MRQMLLRGFLLAAIIAFTACVKKTTQSSGSTVTGTLVDESGNPAAGATVIALDLHHVPWPRDTGSAMTSRSLGWGITDAAGRYTIDLAIAGMMNLFCTTTDGKVVLIDSVLAPSKSTLEVPAATVKPPGTVAGTFYLAGETDTLRPQVNIYIPGTPVISVSDSSRTYAVNGIPEGSYTLMFEPDRSEFSGTFKDAQVAAGSTVTLDTFVLYSDYMTGVPTLDAGADTLVPPMGTINLRPVASDTFGTSLLYEWQCKSATDTSSVAFVPAVNGSLTIVADTIAYQRYQCVCRLTDNDTNVVRDTVVIAITSSSFATALSMCIERDDVYGWNSILNCASAPADSLNDTVIANSAQYVQRGLSSWSAQKLTRSAVDTANDTADMPLSYSTSTDTIKQSVDIYVMDFASLDSALSMYAYATTGLVADTAALTPFLNSIARFSYDTSESTMSFIFDSSMVRNVTDTTYDTTWADSATLANADTTTDSFTVAISYLYDTTYTIDTSVDTTVTAIHSMHAHLNKFYFRWIFSGLLKPREGISLADSVMREYEQKLVY